MSVPNVNLIVEALSHDISPGRQRNRFKNTIASRLWLSALVQEEQRLSEGRLNRRLQPGQPMGAMTEPMHPLQEEQGPASRTECLWMLKTPGQLLRPS